MPMIAWASRVVAGRLAGWTPASSTSVVSMTCSRSLIGPSSVRVEVVGGKVLVAEMVGAADPDEDAQRRQPLRTERRVATLAAPDVADDAGDLGAGRVLCVIGQLAESIGESAQYPLVVAVQPQLVYLVERAIDRIGEFVGVRVQQRRYGRFGFRRL